MTRWLRARHEGGAVWAEAQDDEAVVLSGPPWEKSSSPTGARLARAGLTLLAPVAPTKIVCVGRNYRKHAAELGNEVPSEPLLFLKPPSSVIGPGEAIVRPTSSNLVHHEGELAVVIGERLQRASAQRAGEGIFAFTCANDVTARDIQRSENRFTRAKGFDTFCPIGPELVGRDEVLDEQALDLELRVGDEVRQRSNTSAMVFPVAELCAFISSVMTLEPGDVILTGTPEGVGPLLAGERVTVEIGGIGALTNPVADAANEQRARE